MRSATIAATLVAMASAVNAQVAGFAVFANPAQDEVVFAGKPYVLKWAAGKDASGKPYAGPATLSLIGGETQGTQQPIGTLAAIDVSADTYTWNVDCSLGKDKVYGLKIAMDSDPNTFQWSNRFHIDNSGCAGEDGNPSASSSASQASSTMAATSSSAHSSAPSTADTYPTATAPMSSSTHAVVTSSVYSTNGTTVSTAAYPTWTTSHSAAVGQTTSYVTKPATTASQPTTSANPIPTAAAPKVAAGSLALAGAAVAAILAL